MKSVREQLFDFLQQNRGDFNSGELQRMEFKGRRGTATGKTISRRLQELAEDGKIHVEERRGSAWYSADFKPKPLEVRIKIVDGRAVATY